MLDSIIRKWQKKTGDAEQPATGNGNHIFSPTGRNILLTGGGQGLGASMAVGLAAFGANVAIIELNPETARRTAGALAKGKRKKWDSMSFEILSRRRLHGYTA